MRESVFERNKTSELQATLWDFVPTTASAEDYTGIPSACKVKINSRKSA